MNLEAHGWHKADYTMAVQLTACTHYAGQLFPCSITALDSNLTGIRGLKDAWISGYAQPTLLTPTISGMGGFVVEREDKGTGKGYVWEFVMDGSGQVWYQGLQKPYPGHHFDPASGINLGTLFGNL
jgi:hypothetical protein